MLTSVRPRNGAGFIQQLVVRSLPRRPPSIQLRFTSLSASYPVSIRSKLPASFPGLTEPTLMYRMRRGLTMQSDAEYALAWNTSPVAPSSCPTRGPLLGVIT